MSQIVQPKPYAQIAPLCINCRLKSLLSQPPNYFRVEIEILKPQYIYNNKESYTIKDITENMWFTNGSKGFAWRIKTINSKSTNVTGTISILDCIIEDVDFYNQVINNVAKDTPNIENMTVKNSYIFTLDYDGLPNLVPFDIENKFDRRVVTDLINRFRSRNIYTNFISINQSNHNLDIGDYIYIEDGIFKKSTSATDKVQDTIGIVTSIGRKYYNYSFKLITDNSWFSFKPFGMFIKNDKVIKTLSGTVGSTFYLDISGNYTTSVPLKNQYPVCVKLNTDGDIILLNSRTRQINTQQNTTIYIYYNNGILTKTVSDNLLNTTIIPYSKSISINSNVSSLPTSIAIWGKQYNGSNYIWKLTQSITNSGLSVIFDDVTKKITFSAYSYSNLLGLLGIVNPPNDSELIVCTIKLIYE